MNNLLKVRDKKEYDVSLDECKIKVGGRDEVTGGKFISNINMSKWNDECYVNINYPDIIEDEKEKFKDDKVELKVSDKTHRYYVKDGKLEYEIELEKKPAKNTLKLDLDFSDGLIFYYQPKLTQKEIDEGCGQLENAINSYAVYWKKRNNKYKRGKFCHIFRIKAIDKNGDWVWCEQSIVGKLWTIKILQDFLDNAIYPIIIDPILGYSAAGELTFGNGGIKIGSNDDTDGTGGNITAFHCAVSAVDPTLKSVKLAVYNCDQSTGDPINKTLIEQVEIETVIVSDDNSIAAPEGNEVIASTKYWIGFIPEAPNETKIKYDSGGSAWYRGSSVYADEFVSSWQVDSTSIARLNSVWVDYEEAGGQEFVRSIADNIGIADVLSKSVVFVRDIVDNIDITDVLLRSVAFTRSIKSNGGFTWTQRDSSFGTTTIYGIAHNQLDLWTAVGASGKLATSSNGISWTQQTSSFESSIIMDIAHNGLAGGSGLWVAVGDNGKLATSPDGENWTPKTSSFGTTAIHGIAHNGLVGGSGLWVAVGNAGKLATSPDGENWTQQTSMITNNIMGIGYGSNLWVAVAYGGQLATSSNGTSWTLQTSSFGTTAIIDVAHNGSNLWVAVGGEGKLATSSDGETWFQRTSSFETTQIRDVAHDNFNLWVIGGYLGKLATSYDGENWTLRTSGFGTNQIYTNAYSSNLWIIAGGDGNLATLASAGKIGITDTLSRSVVFVRSIDDNVGLTDVLLRSVTFVRNIADTIGITDVLSKAVVFVKSITDTIGITDTLSKSIIFMRSIKDNIGMTDILSKSMIFIRLITNTIGITDVLSKSGTFVRRITDTINILDVFAFIRMKIDWFGVSKIRKICRIGSPKIREIHRISTPEIKGK